MRNARRAAAIAIVVLAASTVVALRYFSGAASTETTVVTAAGAPAVGAASPDAPPSGGPSSTPSLAPSSPTPSPTPSPSPSPTPSPDPNLLTATNGAFVRRWTVGAFQDDPQTLAQATGSVALVPSFDRPVTLLYELPAIARLERVGVALRGARGAGVRVAVGTDARHLRDVGVIRVALPAQSDVARTLDIAAEARFVRFTLTKAAHDPLRIAAITAAGTPGAPERGSLAGSWLNLTATATASDIGGMRGRVPDTAPSPSRNDDERVAIEEDGRLAFFRCAERVDPWQATLDGGIARAANGTLRLAGNGTVLVGYDGNRAVLAIRATALPACGSSSAGTGPVVASFVRVLGENAPEIDPAMFPRRRFETHFAPLLAAAQLRRANFAVLDGDCSASLDLSPRRRRMLLDWVAAGHKLIIRDADLCATSDYAFLPYRFSTTATGAMGARGSVLAIADPSTLGATRGDPAHVLDVAAYLASKDQQIGDADIMKTEDPHWCGHLFATNALRANGWVHAYARYGRGLIIYDGFDRDDLKAGVPAARRVVDLEYAQSARSDLPCNARVASALALYPSVDRALPAGTAVDVRVAMHLVSTAQTTAQDVELAIDGDARYPARVTPVRVRLAGGGAHAVTARVSLPAGWRGTHAYAVRAVGAFGARAQATILIDGSVALAEAFETQRRVRLYGIHFDVASAVIQPVSEATIAQIAQVLAAHPAWALRVEGHTDGDGGAAYNLDLSLRRAHAVVDDLVARYRVRRARLRAAGFGLTRPVASNGSEAGKALNRRVELVRL